MFSVAPNAKGTMMDPQSRLRLERSRASPT